MTTGVERQATTLPVAGPPPLTVDRTRVEAVLLWTAGAGAAANVWWWWANTPSVHGFGAWLTNAGRLTGLLSGYLLAVLVLLMARTPLLERHVGADRLARWHASTGRYTIGLIVAHTLLIIWGYAVEAHEGLLTQTKSLLVSYPDVLMATVGALLFVGIAYVSAREMRRRLRYETWYYLHLYTYLAVALSFAHTFADGAEFATHPLARVLWSALYVLAIGALVYYRILIPLYRTAHHQVRLERVQPEGPGVVSLVLRGRQIDELRPRPGQFVRLRFLAPGYWWSAHPFSLSAAPRGDRLRVTVKTLGDHTAGMHRLRPGTRVLLEGPYGALTDQRRSRRQVLLLAGGVGITPLRTLFQTLSASPGDLTLVYRAETERELVLRGEIDAIAAKRHQKVHYLPGPVGGENDVLVGTRLSRLVPDIRRHDVYVSGPPGFVEAATQALQRVGVAPGQIHTEHFAF